MTVLVDDGVFGASNETAQPIGKGDGIRGSVLFFINDAYP